MPRLTKATALDRWIDQFSDSPLDEQEFMLAQVQAIHRQAQRQKERNGNGHAPTANDDLPFDEVPNGSGKS